MEPELLTTKQAASVMNIGEERARAILLSRGVQPVSLPWGKERKTLRWSRRAVMTVIDTLHAEAQAKAGVPKRRRSLKTAAVSYTHLDVYKRQGLVRAAIPGKAGLAEKLRLG